MKTKLKNFFFNLQFIFKPWYWIMSGPYSKDIDIIKTIEKNLSNNKNFYDIELITDENDARTSFKL